MSTLNALDTAVEGPSKPIVVDQVEPADPYVESSTSARQDVNKLKKLKDKKEKKVKKDKKDKKDGKKDAKKADKKAKKEAKKEKNHKVKQEKKQEKKHAGSSLQWSSDSEDSTSDLLVDPAVDPAAAEARLAEKAQRKAAKEKQIQLRREERAEKFANYLAQLRVHSPALARDEEDLALAKNTHVAAKSAYKQHREQYRSHKMALLLARKQYKLAHPDASSKHSLKHSKDGTHKDGVKHSPEPGAPIVATGVAGTSPAHHHKKDEEKKKKKAKKDEYDEDFSSSSESSDSSSSSSSSSNSSSAESDNEHSGSDDELETSDSESLEFDPDGVTVLGREAAVNAKSNREHMRLEVHQLRIVQRHARVSVKRKEKQLRRHYKCEKHQNAELSKLDRKRDKIEEKRAEKIVMIHQGLSPRSPRTPHKLAHPSAPRKDILSAEHDLSHAAPSATVPVPATADYKVATEADPFLAPEPLSVEKPAPMSTALAAETVSHAPSAPATTN